MTNCIRVANLDNNTVWENQLTTDQALQLLGFLNGKKVVAPFPSLFKPVRTNTLKNFAKDFFLPTTINQATKVQHAVGKVFAILASLVLDVMTFPLRVVTCIPRAISNAKEPENSFEGYLRGRSVDEQLLESGHVWVRLDWTQRSSYPTTHWTDENGVRHSSYSQESHWRVQNVNFIEVPDYGDTTPREGMLG